MLVALAGILAVASVLAATSHLGAASSAAAMLCTLVFAWALGGSRLTAWIIYLSCALGYLGLALLAGFGVLPLTGSVVALARNNTRALFGLSVVLEIILAICFWLGKRTRAALDETMEQADRAQREIQRRGALLDEARAELRNVMEGAKLGGAVGQRRRSLSRAGGDRSRRHG